MITISTSDRDKVCRYLDFAAVHIKATSDKTAVLDKARLMKNLSKKLKNKQNGD